MSKKLIDMQAFLGNDNDKAYKGRCLGMLTEEEYAGLVTKPELRKKLFTVETTPLIDIGDMKDVEGLRFAMTVTEDEDIAVTKPTLFITEPMDIVSSIVTNNNICLNGKNGSFYIIEEV
jgi:hypothetical protein